MSIKFNTDLSKAFRKACGQSTESCSVTDIKGIPEKSKPENRDSQSAGYSRFLAKYNDLEHSFVRFNTQDLVYFFREKSKEAGAKYVIANMKRDMGIFKRLQDNYSVEEILLMIEFIFSGDQTYLDIHRTQPTVLASNWINTIYRDSIDWANDCYTEKKTSKKIADREWKKSSSNKEIGEW